MLKKTGLSNKSAPIIIRTNVNKIVNGRLEFYLPKSKKMKMTKSKNLAKLKNLTNLLKIISINIGTIGFLISKARIAFTQLRQAFIKVLILQYFDLKCHIWIETNASDYIIGGVLS